MQNVTSHNLTRAYLFRQWFIITLATVCSILLGAVGAGVVALFGPAVKILSENPATTIDLARELGPTWIQLAQHFGVQTAYTVGALMAMVPLTLLVLAGVRAVLSLGQWYLWEYAAETASFHLRRDLMRGFLSFDPVRRLAGEGRTHEEELSATVSTDVRMLREYYVHYYGGLPRELIQVVWYTAILLMLSPQLTAIFFLGVVPGVGVFQNVGRKLRRRAARALSDSSTLTEWLQQRLSGLETIKHYKTEELESRKMNELTTTLFDRFYAAAKTKARTGPLLEVISIVALVIVLVVALGDVARGDVSGAAMLSFFVCVGVLGQSAGKLGRYFNANREGLAARDRIVDRFQAFGKGHRNLRGRSQTAGKTMVLDQVSFVYPQAEKEALRHLSYTFEPGRVYCVVGPSGSGKSTLLRVILGLFEPSSGSLTRPEGRTAADLTYMPQAVHLGQANVAENIAFPEVQVDLSRVKESLQKVDMWDAVSALDQGVDTPIGTARRGLSGGQAQRILLARLWYHESPLVVIDEGTSALDPEGEQKIIRLVHDLAARGSIVVMVAHRPALADASDVVLVMKEGELQHDGV